MAEGLDAVLAALYSHNEERLSHCITVGKQAVQGLLGSQDDARMAAYRYDSDAFERLVEKYSKLPNDSQPVEAELQQLVSDLFIGVPRWESPLLLYNVGTAVNVAAAAAYALSLDECTFSVNDGMAGNTLAAEYAVVNILSTLAGRPKKSHGTFTFGGTGTNLYGMRLGLKKACPELSRSGVPQNMRIFLTEDAHFSHMAAADWLGVGTERIVTLRASKDRTTDLEHLEAEMRSALAAKQRIAAIIVNGGTTYDHAIDPIAAIAKLRDRLAEEFALPYRPHIHVDSVIGWVWLFFRYYDWDANVLGMSSQVLAKVKNQYERIEQIRHADSWGVDFHKGVGSCPATCSVFIANDRADAAFLSRKQGAVSTDIIHQLAAEYSFASPVDYTLETARASGAPLAALAALRTLGVVGYQRNVANLVDQTTFMRQQLRLRARLQITNPSSDGFVTIVRLMPPGMSRVMPSAELADGSESCREMSERMTAYTKAFFDWDYETRMRQGRGPEYSYSSGYVVTSSGAKLGVIKLYPVSPFFDRRRALETVNTIVEQQRRFDASIWPIIS